MKSVNYNAIDIANWFLWYNKVQQGMYVDNDNYDVY